MGHSSSFSTIEKKYHKEGVDYIVSKYHERKIYQRINEQILKLKQNANLQQQQDLSFIDIQKKMLQNNFHEAVKDVEIKNPESLAQSSAKTKQTVQQFSGYNEEMRKIQKIQIDLKQTYEKQRLNMQQNVKKQIQNYQVGLNNVKIPQYDNAPINYKKNIQKQCIKKYPQRAQQSNKTELQQKLNWLTYKQNFENILNRQKLKNDIEDAIIRVRQNILPGGVTFCC